MNPYTTPHADLGKDVSSADPASKPLRSEATPWRILLCVILCILAALIAMVGLFTGALHPNPSPWPAFLGPSTLSLFAISGSLVVTALGVIISRNWLSGIGVCCLAYAIWSFCEIWVGNR